ncbi:MAG: glycosyltransferase family 4 protein [Bacteroidota bacterium]
MRIVLFANSDWYLYNFRLPLAHHLRSLGHEVVLLSPPGEFAERFETEGYAWHAVEMCRRGLNPIEEVRTVRQLRQLYAEIKPDLVHHFTLKSVVYGSLAARRSGVPGVVNAVTGLGYVYTDDSVKARAIRVVLTNLCRAALKGTEVIFQNPDDAGIFVEAGLVPEDQCHLIYGSGVDTERFVTQPEEAGTPTVMLASRMLWGKGVGDFVEAGRLLRDRNVPVRMRLVGPADPDNHAAVPEATLQAWNEEGAVEWLGFREDMDDLLRQSHIVCLPSQYGEGVPRILIEAAASGRPLISTNRPGCREIVHHGTNGLVVPPEDPEALADAIETLVTRPEQRRQFGAAGRELVEAQFSERQVLHETLKVYADAHPDFQVPLTVDEGFGGDGAVEPVSLPVSS